MRKRHAQGSMKQTRVHAKRPHDKEPIKKEIQRANQNKVYDIEKGIIIIIVILYYWNYHNNNNIIIAYFISLL